MIVELHIIQNFAPSNLNRDDTNAPKDCEFGGYRRARISSQCIKRAVRRHPVFAEAVRKAGGDVGVRTKRLTKRLQEVLLENHGKSAAEAGPVAEGVVELLGLKLSDEKTEYLLYLGEAEIDALAKIAAGAWDNLLAVEKTKEKKKKSALPDKLKKTQALLVGAVSKERKAAKAYAADIALFGRMVADSKNMNVDAACQVAHAISTHKVEMEMDYFTAVDDLLPDADSGSDMIGVVEFNSSCFYRYSCIDVKTLRKNLGLNRDLLIASVRGYLEASVKAVPTGKQNSMAAQNPAGFARVLVRDNGFPWSLANAFQRPVFPKREGGVEELSVAALNDYFERLSKVYGVDSVRCDTGFNLNDPESLSLAAVLDRVDVCLEEALSE